MAELTVSIRDFRGKYSSINTSMPITWKISEMHLVYAVIRVGLPTLQAAFGSTHAIRFACTKAFSILSACSCNGPDLCHPVAYANLDPSEKRNLSFWVGMAMTKIAAHQILQVPSLEHAEHLRQLGVLKVRNPRSRSLADLVGQDIYGNWHVLEAKARQSPPRDDDIKKWKSQATTVATIEGKSPATMSYCLANVGEKFNLELVDPEYDERETPRHYEIDMERLQEVRYSPIQAFLDHTDVFMIKVQGRRVRVRHTMYDPVSGKSIFIGLDDDMLLRIMKEPASAIELCHEDEDFYIGPDGITIFFM